MERSGGGVQPMAVTCRIRRQLGRGRLTQPAMKVPAPRPAQAIPATPRVIEPARVIPPKA
jgi:hypothetical protein